MDRAKVEQSLNKIFVLETVEPIPLATKTDPQWKIRFQFIEAQLYCWSCKKWRDDSSYDYCYECGCDFYSHMDLKNGQIAPIKRGRCQKCNPMQAAYRSLNGKLECQMCYYRSVGKSQKAQQICQKLKALVIEIKETEEYKNTLEYKNKCKKYNNLILILSMSQDDQQSQLAKYYQPWMLNWANGTHIQLKRQLYDKLAKKQKQMLERQGISY